MGRRRTGESIGFHADGGVLSMEVLAEDGTWQKVEPEELSGPIGLSICCEKSAFDCRVHDRVIRLARDADRWFVDLS